MLLLYRHLPHKFLKFFLYYQDKAEIKQYRFMEAVCKMNVNKSLDKRTIIVAVIDGTKARFLTLELEQLPDDDFGQV